MVQDFSGFCSFRKGLHGRTVSNSSVMPDELLIYLRYDERVGLTGPARNLVLLLLDYYPQSRRYHDRSC